MRGAIRASLQQTCRLLLLSGACLLLSCSDSTPDPNEVIARAGDVYLTRDVLTSLIPKNIDDTNREVFIRRIVEQWIDNQVLAQVAVKEGVDLSDRERWELENLRAELIANKYLMMKVRKNSPITDQEVEDYYTIHVEQFRRNLDEVHLIHLYLERVDNAIASEIKQSKQLLEVIQKNNLDRQLDRVIEANGDLGYVPFDQLRKEFQNEIKGKKTGIIYGPVKTEEGFHYLQVLDRQEAGSLRSLDLVRNEILTQIQVQNREHDINTLKQSIRKTVEIETFYENAI